MTLRVRNRVTGLVHDVPAGHSALTDGAHDVLRDEPPASLESEGLGQAPPEVPADVYTPDAQPQPAAKPKTKRRTSSRKRK